MKFQNSRRSKGSFPIILGSFFGVFCALLVLGYSIIVFSEGAVVGTVLRVIPKRGLQGVNILAIGVDETRRSKRSDTIMVFHLDDLRSRIGVVSIPRDTRVNIPDTGPGKMNHAYAYGGIKLLRRTVSDFLDIPIDYYIKVNLNGLESIVDHLGGIPLTVEKDLRYNDRAANLQINVRKGKRVLSGSEVGEYLRFRQDAEGDIGRIRRQQTFIKAFVKKILKSEGILASPALFRKVSRSVDTNLPLREMLGFVGQFRKAFRIGNIHAGSVPGSVTMIDGMSYWRPEILEMDHLVKQVLFGVDVYAKNEVRESIFSQIENGVPPTGPVEKSPLGDRRKVTIEELTRVTEQANVKDKVTRVGARAALRIEVLNGNGKAGIARSVARLLRKNKFKIVRVDNSKSFDYPKTLIVDWKGKVQDILVLSDFLHVEPSNIVVYDLQQKSLDVTIVLGKDWPQLVRKIEQ